MIGFFAQWILILSVGLTFIHCNGNLVETGQATREAYAVISPDNTSKNFRDKKGETLTAADQSEEATDRKTTAAIRQSIIAHDSFSTLADNIKIITVNGVVTLRGPVYNPFEREAIGKKAAEIAGTDNIDNQLEVIVQ